MQPVPSPVSLSQQVPSAPEGPVDAARRRLAEIDSLTTLEQVEAFDAVHRLLQDSLASVEQELKTDGPAGPNRQGGHGRR